ncbi:cytochrome c oxidase assembly protein [Chelatococcus sp. GCM10030263]|uniref:cytochrome c oxidase assembly protein n=1 Tax=Chelatococcus sp. GCM10030263 TaxID=3273387 RepID=UPI0036137195
MKRMVFIAGAAASTAAAVLVAPNPQTGAGNLFTLCLTATSSVAAGGLWTAWSFAPAVLVPLLALGLGYAGHARAHAADPQRAMLFASGYLALAAAVASPLCRMAATLASAHMIQHAILVALAPPLILLGFQRARVGNAAVENRPLVTHPGWAAVPYGVFIWFWHVPRLYEAALTDVYVHLLMYASLLGTGFLFWNSVMTAVRSRSALQGWAIVALIVTFIHTGMLGALLTFSGHLWFPIMAPGALIFGLTPLDDQQLAGLIMWVPMGLVYVVAALWAFGRVLAEMEAPAALRQ